MLADSRNLILKRSMIFLCAMQSTSKLYISSIIFHFFRLSAPQPKNSSDPRQPCFTWQDQEEKNKGACAYDVCIERESKNSIHDIHTELIQLLVVPEKKGGGIKNSSNIVDVICGWS